jgi:sugar phosphate isomerase/epimerase
MPRELGLSARFSRRRFCALGTGAIAAAATYGAQMAVSATHVPARNRFGLNYVLASALYGDASLEAVLGEAKSCGATAIDVWSKPHGSQREEIDRLGVEKTRSLLKSSGIGLGVSTRYDLRAVGLGDEIALVHRLGGKSIVTGPGKHPGKTIKEQARNCVESFKREAAMAADHGLKLGIENHAGSLLGTPDGIRYFAEAIDVPNLGIALAPYHLPQEPEKIASLIHDLGEKMVFFQAWQYGKGCMEKLPKEEEMLQMPGRGTLNFRPILAALKQINYGGWTEIFMHPVPRGVPIRDRNEDVTAEINRSRGYLEQCLAANESS